MNAEKWQSTYDAFDGTMPECIGGDCPTPCCNEKEVRIWGGPIAKFNTTIDVAELSAQERIFGPLPEGVTAIKADIGATSSNVRILISGCLSEDGSCKMKDRKPIHCRLYPFGYYTMHPLKQNCPKHSEIGSNPKTQKGIMALREAHGKGDNEAWYTNLVESLSL